MWTINIGSFLDVKNVYINSLGIIFVRNNHFGNSQYVKVYIINIKTIVYSDNDQTLKFN